MDRKGHSGLIITILLVLLSLHHLGDVGVPLAKGIINSTFELLEYTVDRSMEFRDHWQAATQREAAPAKTNKERK